MREIATPPAVIRAAETLDELALVINSTYAAAEEAARKGLDRYREVGLMLLDAKKKCGHGKWLSWLKANVKFSQTQAKRYMQLAKSPVTGDLGDQWRAILGNATGTTDEPEAEAESAEEPAPKPAPKAAPAPPETPAEPEPDEAEEEADEPDADEEPSAEPDPDEQPEAAPPGSEVVERLNKVCAALDRLKAEVTEIAADPFGRHVHRESVVAQISAARKALWQARPTEPCNCVRGGTAARPDCRACGGTGITCVGRVLKGVA